MSIVSLGLLSLSVTIVVSTAADTCPIPTTGSLRAAIDTANSTPGPDSIFCVAVDHVLPSGSACPAVGVNFAVDALGSVRPNIGDCDAGAHEVQ